MNKRIINLRNIILDSVPEICIDRGIAITESFKVTEGLPMIIRRALAFKKILSDMQLYTLPGELIVGNQQCKPKAAPLFPEFGVRWIRKELDSFENRRLDKFIVPEGKKQKILDIIDYWDGKTHQDLSISTISYILPDSIKNYYELSNCSINQVLGNVCHTSNGDGHIIADYEHVLKVGLGGIKDEALECMKDLDLKNPDDQGKKLFLESVIIVCDGVVHFANRFSKFLLEKANQESDAIRKAELMEMSRICGTVPEKPAATFHEALQSYWFIHLAIQIESNGQSISFGRFDQLFHEYYLEDIREGRINRNEALELIECLFLKSMELNKVREWAATEYMTGYNMFQTLTLGGQTPDGNDAANEISYLALEATADLKLTEPTTVVRIHRDTSEEFFMAAVKTLVKHGGGLPAFFNDEAGIPLLLNHRNNYITLEDARNWAIMGCVEPTIPGKFINATGGTCQINLLKVLEITLNHGVNPHTGVKVLDSKYYLEGIHNFDDLWDAFMEQLSFYIDMIPVLMAATCSVYRELTPTPFLSSMIKGRVKEGRDILWGKGSNDFNVELMEVHGLSNTADSLAAMKKLIFEENRLTMDKLRDMLHHNFIGFRREHQMLLNRVPKFGNDDPYVDNIARDILTAVTDRVSNYTTPRGGCYGVSTQTTSSNVPDGRCVGATPDGRLAEEPLADNNSPSPGMDRMGPTASMKSVATLDHISTGMGTLYNMKFHPTALSSESGQHKFMSLIKTFFALKGYQVQFNTVSVDTLRDAKANPLKYRDLIVKVAGYSARFTDLDHELQDQIIARTMFGIE